MKINEIVVDGAAVWVPSNWVEVRVIQIPGRLHRYRVWQAIAAQAPLTGSFDFDHIYDQAEDKTWVSILYLPQEKCDALPLPRAQMRLLTAPKAAAGQFLPRQGAPFMLLAYRWQGEIELCAYRMGLLQHAERGTGGDAGMSALWSRVVQAMPVLAASPLYSMDASLTQQFCGHHAICHTLPKRRGRMARFFESMQ